MGRNFTSSCSTSWRLCLFWGSLVGFAHFFTFRNKTDPVAPLLSALLFVGMLSTSVVLVAGFSWLIQRVRSHVVGLFLLLPFFVSYIFSIGIVVVTVTKCFLRFGRVNPEDDRPYLDTSGIRMSSVDTDMWFYVVVTGLPSIILLGGFVMWRMLSSKGGRSK